ncbi:MAG: dicarboxylate/amino acid:cation symporter [bacterium]
MLKLKLHWQILIALALAVIAGSITGTDMSIAGVTFYSIYDFLGTMFLNALKMIIVPLIASSIIVGMAGMGTGNDFGRLGGKTLAYYATTSLLAILTGLLVVNAMQPGIVDGQPAKDIIGLSADVGETLEKVEGRDAGDVVDIFIRMIPTNVIEAASSNGSMLALIFFSLLFGFYLARIPQLGQSAQQNFWQGLLDIMMKITDLVIRFSPIGVFGLVAKVIATTGFEAFAPLMSFFIAVILALLIHVLITMPLMLRFVGGVKNPFLHFKAMMPALLMSFSTSSSSATLPVTMECVEENAGVSKKTSSFTLPLGATVNMDGTALYECVAAMFIAQAYGLELSFATQFTIVLVALMTSIGVAGIPSASLVAITLILGAIGLPLEAIGLILVVDRVLDMCRTSVNVFSDSCGAVIIARSEGESNVLRS